MALSMPQLLPSQLVTLFKPSKHTQTSNFQRWPSFIPKTEKNWKSTWRTLSTNPISVSISLSLCLCVCGSSYTKIHLVSLTQEVGVSSICRHVINALLELVTSCSQPSPICSLLRLVTTNTRPTINIKCGYWFYWISLFSSSKIWPVIKTKSFQK